MLIYNEHQRTSISAQFDIQTGSCIVLFAALLVAQGLFFPQHHEMLVPCFVKRREALWLVKIVMVHTVLFVFV